MSVTNGRSDDPTRTKTLRKRYAARLRSGFRKINAAIRRGVRSNDVFGLREADALADAEELRTFSFESESTRRENFIQWLKRQFDRLVLSRISQDDNEFIRDAYRRGMVHSDERLKAADIELPDTSIEGAFDLPVHTSTLERLYSRSFERLREITDDVADAIAEELTNGFDRGWSPTRMARALTDRVNSIGIWRATVLARTETINAYTESSIERYRSAGVERVSMGVEFLSADDDRVCPICASLDDEEWDLGGIESATFSFEAEGDDVADHHAGTYSVRPPVHPQCRCVLLPVG